MCQNKKRGKGVDAVLLHVSISFLKHLQKSVFSLPVAADQKEELKTSPQMFPSFVGTYRFFALAHK